MEPKHIGRYDIKALIGQGGMSAVYLGYDPRSLREVAIKILPPYFLHSPKFRERFDREAVTIAILEHPAIVPVYDMGEEDGQPYIVMRYMSGGSLSDKLKNGPIPLRECMEMYLRLAPALDTAHARGIIHRDIKPDNLLFDKYNNVFLSDFGLARLRETIGFANITDGSILGTPAYMSPEQIQGDHEIDGRSDIYSLGVMLYHMLCGSVPFNGPTAAAVMMMHLINPVPEIHQHNPSLPIAIQTVIETSMAKNPKDRFQTVGDLARAIQAVNAGMEIRLPNQSARPAQDYPPQKPAAPSQTQTTAAIPPRQSSAEPVQTARGDGNKFPTPVNAPRASLNIPGKPINTPPQGLKPLHLDQASATSQRKKRQSLPVWVWVLSAMLILVLALGTLQWWRGGFPFSLLPGSARTFEEIPSPTVLGQADKLAFLYESDIWVSNLDGSSLKQLTTDVKDKSQLNWSPDGRSLLYVSGICLHAVDLETAQARTLTCFPGASITSFTISPSGQDVALGLDALGLYLLPYAQLTSLPANSTPDNLVTRADCAYHAPYQPEFPLKGVRWSPDNQQLALLLAQPLGDMPHDAIQVLDFGQCAPTPTTVNTLLPELLLFTLRGYFDQPALSSFSWDGADRLLVTSMLQESGFGDLMQFTFGSNQSQPLTPNGSCCYRDAHLSPDGTYLFYSFQPESGGKISLYYLPWSEISTPGNSPTPLAFPAGFLAGSLESLQPALRPAR